jgi:acyl-coenzyme A synthetase/AMP-(fatty) acid ligase
MSLRFLSELGEWAVADSGAIAVKTPEHTVTVGELTARVNALSRSLLSARIPSEAIVAVSADGVDEVIGLLAVCANGSIPVVAPSQPEFESTGSTFLVTRNREWAPQSAIRISDEREPGPLEIREGSNCVGLLTSGTTGRPKLALLTDDRIDARLEGYFDWWPTEKFATLFRLSAVSGLFTMLAAIRSRTAMVFIPVVDHRVAEFCDAANVRHVYGSPHHISMLIELAEKMGQKLSFETVSTAGAPQTSQFLAAVRQVCSGQIRSIYGSTEAGGIALSVEPSNYGFRGSIGRGAEVQIVDGNSDVVGKGIEGIVRLRAPGLIESYRVDGQRVAVSEDGWFYPGDIGLIDSDGMLVITRRDGDIVNVGGAKVNPIEFEAFAESVDGVKDAGCASVTFPDGSAHLVLAVVVAGDMSYRKVVDAFSALPESNRPNIVVAVPSIPRNRNGKLMRDDLSERLTRSISIQPTS